MSYYPEPDSHVRNKIEVELDLPNYAKHFTKFNTLKAKVNSLDKKAHDTTTLFHINKYNIDKQNLEEKIGDIDKKNIPGMSGLVTTTVLNTKISEVENKILDTTSLMTTTVLNTIIGEVEDKVPDHSNMLLLKNLLYD